MAGSVEGNFGIDGSGFLKLSALVKSPTAARRQALKLGTSAPKRVSRNRNTEVWSKRSEDTNPPRLNGETISMGTRKPKPIGPVIAGVPITVGSGTAGAVTYSPGVPGGAVSGGTWSKNPPFSSYVTRRRVLAHSAGFTRKESRMSERIFSPKMEGDGGWSEVRTDPTSQETCGRFADATSDRKSTGN